MELAQGGRHLCGRRYSSSVQAKHSEHEDEFIVSRGVVKCTAVCTTSISINALPDSKDV